MKLLSHEPLGLRAQMEDHARRRGARQEGLAFYVAESHDCQIVRITLSRDWLTAGMTWHFSASIGCGPHGSPSTRKPTDEECAELQSLLRCGSTWEEEPEGGNPHVRHFFGSAK